MERLLAVGLGGLGGTLCRYLLSGWVARRYGESFPAGTLVVNLTGCLLIGFLYHLLEERLLIDPILRTGILIGFWERLRRFPPTGCKPSRFCETESSSGQALTYSPRTLGVLC